MTAAPSTRRAFMDRIPAARRRFPRTPLARLALIVVLAMALDVAASAAVWVDRRDDPLVPDFRQASLAGVGWDVDTYRDAPPVLGFSPILPAGATRDSRGRIRAGSAPAGPDTILRYVLGALDEYDRSGDRRWVRAASLALGDLLARSPSGLMAHTSQVTDVLGRSIDPPWYASATQGLTLSALARMHEITGNPRWRQPAAEVFATLYSFRGFFSGSRPAPEHWLTSLDGDGYLWFDRFSAGLDTTGILTEQLTTAFGVYDYRRVLARGAAERRAAESLLSGTLATLHEYLPRYRTPSRISVSSLAGGNHDLRDHQVATTQLNLLGEVTGSEQFDHWSKLFDLDDRLPYFPVRPVDLRSGVDVYSPLPAELAPLAGRRGPAAVRSDGRPVLGPGIVDPTRNARFALAALERYRVTGDKVLLDRAESAVAAALGTARKGFLTYDFDQDDVSGEPLPQPWHSAEGEGLMLSALTRLSEETGEARWRSAADDAFRSLTSVREYGYPGPRPWLAFLDYSGYLWFEQYPGGAQPSRVLRGHVDALLGLYDYWSLTGSSAAVSYFQGGLTSLRDALPEYIRRPGGYARSNLVTEAASPQDHVWLTGQIAALADVTGDRVLTRYSRLLADDYASVRGEERCAADVRCSELITE